MRLLGLGWAIASVVGGRRDAQSLTEGIFVFVTIVERVGSRLSHWTCLILELERSLATEADFMLLFHLIDLGLLLLHDFWQLELVVDLWGEAALGACLFGWVVHLQHFSVSRSLVELDGGTILLHLEVGVCLADLVCYSELCLLLLIHLDWWGSWAICGLVGDLNLTLTNLNSSGVVLTTIAVFRRLFVANLR